MSMQDEIMQSDLNNGKIMIASWVLKFLWNFKTLSVIHVQRTEKIVKLLFT